MCFDSWLLLVKLSVLAKRLARKTSLRKPNRGEGIISTKHRPKSVMIFLVYYIVLLRICVVLHDIFHTPMTRYSLFVPLNNNQLTT